MEKQKSELKFHVNFAHPKCGIGIPEDEPEEKLLPRGVEKPKVYAYTGNEQDKLLPPDVQRKLEQRRPKPTDSGEKLLPADVTRKINRNLKK